MEAPKPEPRHTEEQMVKKVVSSQLEDIYSDVLRKSPSPEPRKSPDSNGKRKACYDKSGAN